MILIQNTLFIKTRTIDKVSLSQFDKTDVFYVVAPFLVEILDRAFDECRNMRWAWVPNLKIIGYEGLARCNSLVKIIGS